MMNGKINNSQRFVVKHICSSHQPALRPKPAKELAYPNARTDRKDAAKLKEKLTGKINNETPTKCICHKGFSGYSSIVARSKFRGGGQEIAPQSLTAHTLDRYLQV